TGRGAMGGFLAGKNPIDAVVSAPLLADLLEKGKSGGYPADIKLIYSAGGNLFNQCPNAAKVADNLDGVEFIVGQDHFLTPTTRHADIVLPATTFWERNDVHTPWAGAGHYAIFMNRAIEPVHECRNDLDIFADLAERVGIEGYNDKDEDTLLRELSAPAVDDFDTFKALGVARFPAPEDAVAFSQQINDPDNHKFSTPSGKIEVYCTTLADNPDPYGLGAMAPIPTWVPHLDADAAYPLQMCSAKSRSRTHSVHANQEKLSKVDPDYVWMHPRDADVRGIHDGQMVKVVSAHGATILPAKVTEDMAPGVTSMNEGAWFTPNEDGVDTEGCANAVTADVSAPCGATTYNTNFVEVRPVNI
ncbi:MAG: molybdopterin-dependent oxidoreductase, partial [Alphaproteobacteria bacterium]|nr:molybdopterin-dependent oxidoreductase [Alphaproteobacteria bacterium]